MVVPQTFTDEWKAKMDGAKVFGVPIENLSREELLAVIGYLEHSRAMSLRVPDVLANELKRLPWKAG